MPHLIDRDRAIDEPVEIRVEAQRLRPFVSEALARLVHADHPTSTAVDGTLVFADVSGFTALTERLAQHGRLGAEEMSDVINAVFAPMIDVAIDHGGDLLKYGGDALLLLFTGQHHAWRAVAAAVGMRAAMRANPTPRQVAGVRLRMSIGVHSGPVELFAVGDRWRELVVAGRTLGHTLHLEHEATADEILVSPATAAATRAAVRTYDDPRGRLVQRLIRRPDTRSSGPAWASAPTPVAEGAIELMVDPRIRAVLGAEPPAEHRLITVGFVRFAGLDALVDDGSAFDALQRLVSAAQHVTTEHGVTLLTVDADIDGGKLLLLGGVPAALGDDDERLALAVTQLVAAGCPPLALSGGIEHGVAFTGPIGSPDRRDYSALGDVVNLAARLMARAEPGQVVCTADTAEQFRTVFHTSEMPPFQAKGKAAPIDAVVLGAPAGYRRDAHRVAHLPFAGRADELRILTDAISAGDGRLVRVVAEPGAGKSRLVTEAHLSAGGPLRLNIECGRYSQGSPYRPLQTALRTAVGIDPDLDDDAAAHALGAQVDQRVPHLGPWLPLLAVPFGFSLGDTATTATLSDEFRQERMLAVVREALPALLPQQVLAVVEDAQWLDTASADVVADLVRHLRHPGWTWVLTQRPEPSPLDQLPGHTLRLAPLGAESLDELIDAVPGLSRAVRARLADKCQGNPFFLESLVDAVRHGADLEALPDKVEAVVGAQYDRLDDAHRRLVAIAAVLGLRFPLVLLDEIASEMAGHRVAVRDELASLTAFVSIDPTSGEVRFRHALLRDTAYERLPMKERRRLHARAATIIEQRAGTDIGPWAQLLAVHHFRAEQFEPAARYLRIAGEQARRGLAPHDAIRCFEQALTADRACGRRGDLSLFLALAELLETTGEYTRSDRYFERARQRLDRGDPRRATLLGKRAHLDLQRGATLTSFRRYRAAESMLDQAREPSATAEVRSGLASALVRLGRLDQAAEVLDKARDLALQTGDRPTLAHVDQLLDGVLADLGRTSSVDHGAEALRLYRELGDRSGEGRALNNQAITAYYAGEWDDAIDLYQQAADAHDSAGDEAEAASSLVNLAEVLLAQGHLQRVRPALDRAIDTHRRINFQVGLGYDLMLSGMWATAAGDTDRARVDLHQAEALFTTADSRPLLDEVCVRWAELLLADGDHDAVRARLETLEHPALMPALRAQAAWVTGRSLHHEGRTDDASAAWTAGLRVAREASTTLELARLLRSLAGLGALTAAESAELSVLEARLGLLTPT